MSNQAYQTAVEIQVEQAEWGQLDTEGWPAWSDEIRYVPTDLEEDEAISFMDAHPVEAFEAWVGNLNDREFREIASALDILRRAITRYHASKSACEPSVNTRDVLGIF